MAWCRQANIDQDLCRHMAPLGHNALINIIISEIDSSGDISINQKLRVSYFTWKYRFNIILEYHRCWNWVIPGKLDQNRGYV